MNALELARRTPAFLTASRARPALAWAAATFLVLAALAGGPGVSRDEAAVLAAAERGGAAPLLSGPTPPLGPALAAASDAALSRAGLSHLRAARLGSAGLGALLSALLALLAWELAGPAAALLAPALFWLAPRHLQAGLVATPDLALAALVVAAALAWRGAVSAPDGRPRLLRAARAGLFLGAALAARTDAWVVVPALALHALSVRTAAAREKRPVAVGAPLALACAAAALVLGAAWPWLWGAPLARTATAFTPLRDAAWLYLGTPLSGRLPVAYPIVVTALTLPATLLWAYAGGLGHAALRIWAAARGRLAPGAAPDEVLLVALTAAPVLAALAGLAPAVSGVRPWLHAMPFAAVLAARALLAAARTAWPARATALAASLALVTLYPGLRATAHFHPAGASAWNELAGGAPGAATLGMQRLDGGEVPSTLVAAVNDRARGGARIWWPSSTPAALRTLARDGRLRADLVVADGPEDADLAVVTLDGASRDAEYRTWSAFRSARPAAGAYLDEVPLAFVYARPGCWR